MIQVQGLTRRYGDTVAVSGLSFSVQEGEIVGFLGPNGAGKTTTMNMITGCLRPTAGTAVLGGFDIDTDADQARKMIGYLPENPPLYPDMTVSEYLEFVYALKKCTLPKDEHLAQVCGMTGLTEVSGRLIRNLSKGYRQRTGLAQALIGDPKVLILDEPTVGLDPKQIIEIRKLIKSLGKKHTVIFSSHVLSEISATCDRIIVISNGKIVADAKTEELSTAVSGEEKLSLEIEGASADIISAIKKIPAVIRANKVKTIRDNTAKYMVEYEKGVDIRRDVFSAMARIGCPILNMQSGNETLEDMFLKLTTGDRNNYRENGGNS